MRAITEINFVPYSTELVLPPLYGLRPYLPFPPDSTMFVLLWLMTWSFLLTWLTAKVCFKEVTRADHEEVIHEEHVRETEPRDLPGEAATAPLPATNAAVDDAMARAAKAAECEASAKAAMVAAMARAVEATKRERATFAAAEAAEAAAAGPFGEMHNTTPNEREARMRDATAAAGAAWRAWAADRTAAAKAAAEAADAESKLEAAEAERVAAEGRARAERELARG
jgi:cytoskeletal protein RodZ